MAAAGWHRKRKNTPAELARDARYRTPEYRAAARALAQLVETSEGFCWRCGGWIDPSMKDRAGKRAWHVGHDDTGTQILGPEHNSCNLTAAASKGARTRNAAQRATRVRL